MIKTKLTKSKKSYKFSKPSLTISLPNSKKKSSSLIYMILALHASRVLIMNLSARLSQLRKVKSKRLVKELNSSVKRYKISKIESRLSLISHHKSRLLILKRLHTQIPFQVFFLNAKKQQKILRNFRRKPKNIV